MLELDALIWAAIYLLAFLFSWRLVSVLYTEVHLFQLTRHLKLLDKESEKLDRQRVNAELTWRFMRCRRLREEHEDMSDEMIMDLLSAEIKDMEETIREKVKKQIKEKFGHD